MPSTQPNFVIQTASLFASGDASAFNGTGGPAPYDPFTGLFDGTVSSTLLGILPYDDSVSEVDAGDEVTFVIALDNFGSTAYGLTIRNTVPTGFIVPVDGAGLSVQTGAGTPLDFSGNLFDPAGGLTITSPVAAFDASSGNNVALVTFTLQATSAIPVPLASITDSAQIVSYSASVGGPDVAAYNSTSLSASTVVGTGGITVTSAADQTISTLPSGQTASVDITVTLPEGTVQDLRLTQATPASGAAWLNIVSAQIVQFGANLSATAPVTVQPDGSIALGNVTDTPDNLSTADDQIVVRVTVANAGTTSGTGTLQTTVSAADPNANGSRWSTTVTNTVALAKPNAPPVLAGISASQNTTSSAPVLPFATLTASDADIDQTETLVITLSDPSLGTLSGAGLGTDGAGHNVLTGSAASVQAQAQALVFTPASGASGTEQFGLDLSDGIAHATGTAAVTVQPASLPSTLPSFLISPQTVLTSTATGSSTFAQVQTYGGPLDDIQSQFLYDGATPLAVVALQPSMLISSQASQTAVQLLAGNNLIDTEIGSAFITSGSGNDTIILNAAQSTPTWDTIANFHAGDSVTIYGFDAGVSTQTWQANQGAPGWTGATLHLDVDGDGTADGSVTFTGLSLEAAENLSSHSGTVAGRPFLVLSTS